MKPVLEIAIRDVDYLHSHDGNHERLVSALSANPFLQGNGIGRIDGVCDGKTVGYEYVFPVRIKTPRGIFDVLAGSSLNVDPEYRKTGLGMMLPELRWQHSPSKTALGAGLSQMAVPVHTLLDYNVFLLPRYLMPWKSRAVVETRLKGLCCRIVSGIIDAGICIYALFLRLMAGVHLRGLTFESVPVENEAAINQVAKIISEDAAAFSEVHDELWLKWHLGNTFSKYGPLKLCVAKRNGETVGFYMVKVRFHEQASHRGFKNVWLGSVVEWGTTPAEKKNLPWLLVHAALSLRKSKVDVVQLPTDDRDVIRCLKRFGWRQVGESNFVIKAGEGSPLYGNAEMADQRNWRLRPAMGDVGLD